MRAGGRQLSRLVMSATAAMRWYLLVEMMSCYVPSILTLIMCKQNEMPRYQNNAVSYELAMLTSWTKDVRPHLTQAVASVKTDTEWSIPLFSLPPLLKEFIYAHISLHGICNHFSGDPVTSPPKWNEISWRIASILLTLESHARCRFVSCLQGILRVEAKPAKKASKQLVSKANASTT